MKMQVTRAPLAGALPFNIDDLKAHLRIDSNDDILLLESMGCMAAQELEQLAQLALLHQTIRQTILDPGKFRDWRLAIGPVADDASLTVTVDGEAFSDFELVGGVRAMVRLGESYPYRQRDRLTFEYQAGFGDQWSGIPADLTQALFDQAGMLYDGRSPMSPKTLTTSPHMARVAARYRGVQL